MVMKKSLYEKHQALIEISYKIFIEGKSPKTPKQKEFLRQNLPNIKSLYDKYAIYNYKLEFLIKSLYRQREQDINYN